MGLRGSAQTVYDSIKFAGVICLAIHIHTHTLFGCYTIDTKLEDTCK